MPSGTGFLESDSDYSAEQYTKSVEALDSALRLDNENTEAHGLKGKALIALAKAETTREEHISLERLQTALREVSLALEDPLLLEEYSELKEWITNQIASREVN